MPTEHNSTSIMPKLTAERGRESEIERELGTGFHTSKPRVVTRPSQHNRFEHLKKPPHILTSAMEKVLVEHGLPEPWGPIPATHSSQGQLQ